MFCAFSSNFCTASCFYLTLIRVSVPLRMRLMFCLCVKKIKQVSSIDIPKKLDFKKKYTRNGPNIAAIKADKEDPRKITADHNQIMHVIIPKVKLIEVTIPM